MISDDVERWIMEWTMMSRAEANVSAGTLLLHQRSASQKNEDR
jgi:hypothetical protein